MTDEDRQFERVLEIRRRRRASSMIIEPWYLREMLREHTAAGHILADVTPVSDPEHSVVGHEWAGHDHYDQDRGKRWFCFSHDANGYWMYATDGSGHWTNVSEAAIGRSFHEIHRMGGKLYCHWYRPPRVPGYVGQEFTRHREVTVA